METRMLKINLWDYMDEVRKENQKMYNEYTVYIKDKKSLMFITTLKDFEITDTFAKRITVLREIVHESNGTVILDVKIN